MPLYENKQELEASHLSFDNGSNYPKLGEFPHSLLRNIVRVRTKFPEMSPTK